ncbi:substrate-binding periplasmic protein [Pseudomonas sp. N040]|uniref:substrate-binding periplasmic protein n=1 Tax=Pseudomonas sp. N040 TaxID=2785325 RepID=UPI0018A2ED98|nr:transporter substrate-binding domain-containing protein [Pseudomonas sp. N040]MBF7728976.1 transporter substrate-binding domain-containing protein [Pseudomonas sp. N040]MBW7012616.1 transporter substrate-binding domain-containing protein [Pseudomonas sp. N040]
MPETLSACRLRRPRWLLPLLCWSVLLLAGRPAVAESLLAIGDEWCPYNCASDNPRPGYLVELLRDIYAEQGLQVEYRVVPWSRALKMMADGKADLLLATTPETTPGLPLSVAVGEDRTCFYVPRGSAWRYSGLAELQQRRFGVIQDYSYDGGGALDGLIAASTSAAGPAMASSGENALQNNFNKLLAGRVDLVLENCAVGSYSLRRYGLRERIQSAGSLPGYRGVLNIGFNPAAPDAHLRLEQLRAGLEQRRRSGALQQLLEAYGLVDWVPAAQPY